MTQKTFLKILFTIISLFFVFYKVDFNKIILSFGEIDVFILFISLIIFILYNFLIVFRFKQTFSLFSREKISYLSFFKTYFIGSFYNFFLPTSVGGDISKVFYLPGNISKKRKLLIVAADRSFGFIILLFMTFISFLINPIFSFKLDLVKIFLFIFVLFLVLSFLINKYKEIIIKTYYRFSKLNKRKLLLIFLNSFILQLLIILVHYLTAMSIGFPLTYVSHLLVVGLTTFLVLMPITISGFGLREIGYISLYGLFYVSSEDVVVKTLFIYLFNMLSAFVGLYFVLLNKDSRKCFDFSYVKKYIRQGINNGQ